MDENLSPVSAIEDIEAALNEAPICEYPDFTDAIREVLALARQAEALQRENAELREVGDTLAAQTRSYQRGFSGTLPLGQALNNWDKASARALLGGENAE